MLEERGLRAQQEERLSSEFTVSAVRVTSLRLAHIRPSGPTATLTVAPSAGYPLQAHS